MTHTYDNAEYNELYLRTVARLGYPSEDSRREFNAWFYKNNGRCTQSKPKNIVARFHKLLQTRRTPEFIKNNRELIILYESVLADYTDNYETPHSRDTGNGSQQVLEQRIEEAMEEVGNPGTGEFSKMSYLAYRLLSSIQHYTEEIESAQETNEDIAEETILDQTNINLICGETIPVDMAENIEEPCQEMLKRSHQLPEEEAIEQSHDAIEDEDEEISPEEAILQMMPKLENVLIEMDEPRYVGTFDGNPIGQEKEGLIETIIQLREEKKEKDAEIEEWRNKYYEEKRKRKEGQKEMRDRIAQLEEDLGAAEFGHKAEMMEVMQRLIREKRRVMHLLSNQKK